MRTPTNGPGKGTALARMTQRDRAVEKIHQMLKDGRHTSREMQAATGVQKDTLNAYLRYMRKTLRTIRPTERKRRGGRLWELGEVPDLHVAKRRADPPKQIGMHRDPLIAALFGPAHQ